MKKKQNPPRLILSSTPRSPVLHTRIPPPRHQTTSLPAPPHHLPPPRRLAAIFARVVAPPPSPAPPLRHLDDLLPPTPRRPLPAMRLTSSFQPAQPEPRPRRASPEPYPATYHHAPPPPLQHFPVAPPPTSPGWPPPPAPLTRTTPPPPHPWWSYHHRDLSRCRIWWDPPPASSSSWDPVGSASSVVVLVGSAPAPSPFTTSLRCRGPPPRCQLPRSGRAPSTRAGAAKFVGRRPSVPLFHLPSSVAGAARPWACSALRLLVQCRSGIRQDCSFVVVATCHSDFLVILYFTRLGCRSRAHPVQLAGASCAARWAYLEVPMGLLSPLHRPSRRPTASMER
ncbi:hypothetical protein ACQJBY_048735 [Aegilops geniculata]